MNKHKSKFHIFSSLDEVKKFKILFFPFSIKAEKIFQIY